jgi:ribosomal protein S18 acetylase RimI-like enzyme
VPDVRYTPASEGILRYITTFAYCPLTPADEPFLWDMLYLALYVPPGQPALPRDVLRHPQISRYVQGWGQADDIGLLALDGDRPIGAAWLRLLTGENQGFGYVDDATPELSIAVLPEYRDQGIGSALLTRLLEAARSRFAAVCLSVSPGNPARRLYEGLGFRVANDEPPSITMVRRT